MPEGASSRLQWDIFAKLYCLFYIKNFVVLLSTNTLVLSEQQTMDDYGYQTFAAYRRGHFSVGHPW